MIFTFHLFLLVSPSDICLPLICISEKVVLCCLSCSFDAACQRKPQSPSPTRLGLQSCAVLRLPAPSTILVQTTTKHITDQMVGEAVALQAPSERCSPLHCAERAWYGGANRRAICGWGGMFGRNKPPASKPACGFGQNLAFLNVAQMFESHSVSRVARRKSVGFNP